MSEKSRTKMLTLVHGLLLLSFLTNLFLVAALASTYLNNVYFRLWVDASVPQLAGTLVVAGVGLGLLVNFGMVLNGLKKRLLQSLERTVERRLAGPE